ncbi:MAG: MraY family glycosyltransferase, partial [Candidatus Gracilibacteria bacterium]|nr:MraY family glycosyltransferase [Candidatus Gracilibacteria bacterium]
KKYGYSREPVPYSMGIVFFVNFLILSLVFVKLGLMEYSSKLLVIIIFGFIITLMSFVDDLKNISPKIRLAVQILIGAIISLTSIKIGYISNIFGGITYLDYFKFEIYGITVYLIPLLFTIFWYVLVFNSINWSDGIPGLTSGLTSISLFIILILSVKLFIVDKTLVSKENSEFVIKLISIILPTVFLFALYDRKPKMLMGDSGTMFIAFIIATSAVIAGGKIATVATVLGVYLIDAFYVIFLRIYHKKNPLKKDFSHLHHRLLKLGLSKTYIKTFIFTLSFLFGLFAIMLNNSIQKAMLFAILAWIIVLISSIGGIEKTEISEEKIAKKNLK